MWTNKQQEFLDNATKRYNIKCGARRSGKTYLDYFVIPKRIRSVAGLDGHIFILGHTKQTLQTNIIEPLQKLWGKAFVSDIKSNNTAIMFGDRVYCLGTDNIKQAFKVKGASMKYLYCDEIVTYPPEVFREFLACLDKPYSKMDATCNPGAPDHHIKQFIDSNADDVFYQQYNIYDNDYLDVSARDSIVRDYEGLPAYTGRYIWGEWTKAEGLIYGAAFDKDFHIAPNEDRNYTKYWISVDHGVQNATSMGIWGLCDDIYYRIDEYYHSGRESGIQKTVGEYYDKLDALAAGRRIENVIVDPAAASFIIEIRKRGKYSVRNAKNDVLPGIEDCCTALKSGKVKFNASCKNIIKEFGLYGWDEKSGEDKPIKENDHCMDEFRYFVHTVGVVRGLTRLIGC